MQLWGCVCDSACVCACLCLCLCGCVCASLSLSVSVCVSVCVSGVCVRSFRVRVSSCRRVSVFVGGCVRACLRLAGACVHVRACVRAFVRASVCACMQLSMYTYVRERVCVRGARVDVLRVCVHICMYVSIHACRHVCLYAYIYVCMYVSMHTISWGWGSGGPTACSWRSSSTASSSGE